MAIYLINDHDGEEAAYEVQTEEQVEAIQTVDAGAYRCDFAQYLEMQQRLESLDCDGVYEGDVVIHAPYDDEDDK